MAVTWGCCVHLLIILILMSGCENSCGCGLVQADATGALEAVKAAVGVLPQDRVSPRFLLAAASDISASDVDLAFASGALILGFNIEPSESVQAAAKQYGEHPCIFDMLHPFQCIMH